ncbi:type II toxin-antitoxin system VapC family toxin [Paramicrobacterium chengjingii]|uniref:Ribonuclease VapC n=1 Tax=Paramicrobacterium chengjingii TaxID=2769067 RepID=A0ABX6YIR6_9MICO|nr:type II toxin-antitoxin system VapC family toxin [Microbacterium chengjingii]QPZ38683.1 type II toxin-antitoxin system VapC family toxin [Microbacterium chengjingii]
MIYIDTSAVVKTLVSERGSSSVRRLFATSERLVSSRLLAVELNTAAQRRGLPAVHVDETLSRVNLVSVDDDVLDGAIRLQSGLRGLDALHLATAILIGDELTVFLAFDPELNAAARRSGLALHPASADG